MHTMVMFMEKAIGLVEGLEFRFRKVGEEVFGEGNEQFPVLPEKWLFQFHVVPFHHIDDDLVYD